MALVNKSLFNYGIEITALNKSLDFKSSALGPVRQATLNQGYYSLFTIAQEIGRAMIAVDPSITYSVGIDRNIAGGTENRLTIITSGTYLDLLFNTGPRASTSCAGLIGFDFLDYTGATSYTSTYTVGINLIPEYVGYSYLGPKFMQTVFGSLNISARGDKEAIVWQTQKFFQVEFRFEPEAKVINEWSYFMEWAIQQKPIEFSPDISDGVTSYLCTLESTDADARGLGYKMTEMLPDFPFNYRTGILKFRQKVI